MTHCENNAHMPATEFQKLGINVHVYLNHNNRSCGLIFLLRDDSYSINYKILQTQSHLVDKRSQPLTFQRAGRRWRQNY